jgi:hypothetical protein
MIFIDNPETKRYYEIIENARLFPIPSDTYTEKHHIIPRCFYKAGWVTDDPNNPDNLVVLTSRDHFICHQLLTQMLSKEHPGYYKMSHAFFLMCRISPSQIGRYIPTPEEYESAKILHSVAISKASKGKPKSAEHRANMSKAHTSKKRKPFSAEARANMSKPRSAEHKANISKGQTGRKHTDEAKANMSKAQSNRSAETKAKMSKPRSADAKANMSKAASNRSAETKANMSKASKGKPKSAEHRANMSKARKGKPKSAEHRANMSKPRSAEAKANMSKASVARYLNKILINQFSC